MTVREPMEIQRAHDLLVGIINGDVPLPPGLSSRQNLMAAASVLCWVLQHDMAGLEAGLAAKGFVLENCGS